MFASDFEEVTMTHALVLAEALIIVCVLGLSVVAAELLFERRWGLDALIRCLLYSTGIATGAQLGEFSHEQAIWTTGISGALALLVFGGHSILWTLRKHRPRP